MKPASEQCRFNENPVPSGGVGTGPSIVIDWKLPVAAVIRVAVASVHYTVTIAVEITEVE